jgi:Reverse transcriptase (RNA-dependent DNA polymerase)
MMKHKVFVPVRKESLPPGTKLIDSTWAMKKKANGTHRARLAARGFKQEPGAHYNPDSTSSPVVSDVSVRILFVLAAMTGWPMHVMDVQGAFLHGEFEDGETIYMKVPQGFDRYYDAKEYVLKLLKTLYGLIQAALAFWKKLVLAS